MHTLAYRRVGNAMYKVLGGVDSSRKPYYAVSIYRNNQYIRTDNYSSLDEIETNVGIKIEGRK